jgi:lipoprotein signal peptidase
MKKFLLNAPALAPPKGVKPEPGLSGHWDERHLFYIVWSICMAIITLFVLIRIYTKWKVIKKFEAADCEYLKKGVELWANSSTDFIIASYVGYFGRSSMINQLMCSIQAISINVLVFSVLAMPHGWGAHQWNVKIKMLFDLLYVRLSLNP